MWKLTRLQLVPNIYGDSNGIFLLTYYMCDVLMTQFPSYKMANNTSMEHVEFSNENLINAVQTEPTLWDPTGSTSVYKSSNRWTSIRRYWKYFGPSDSSGNSLLNAPKLFLFATNSFTHVLCFLLLFSEIVSAAQILLLNTMLHAVIITSSSSAILT